MPRVPLRPRGHLAHELLEEAASIAGALHKGDDGPRGQAQEIIEPELDGALDGVALDAQPPGAHVDDRGRRMLANEEVTGRVR